MARGDERIGVASSGKGDHPVAKRGRFEEAESCRAWLPEGIWLRWSRSRNSTGRRWQSKWQPPGRFRRSADPLAVAPCRPIPAPLSSRRGDLHFIIGKIILDAFHCGTVDFLIPGGRASTGSPP